MSHHVVGAVVSRGIPVSIDVQVALSRRGLPLWRFSGRVTPEVREGKDRIMQALQGLSMKLPRAKVQVAMHPAEVRKKGAGLDLPLAIAYLQACQLLPTCSVAAVGEIDIQGRLHSVTHEYALADHLLKRNDLVIVPREHFAAWRFHPSRAKLCFCRSLSEVLAALREHSFEVHHPEALENTERYPEFPVSPSLVRILSVAIAGGHHTLLFGAPGVGKTYTSVMAEYLLPEEDLETHRQRSTQADLSISSSQAGKRAITLTPSMSATELFGTLHHPGMLSAGAELVFLDELPEFSRSKRDALRPFMEIADDSKGERSAPTLVATANPCPCGFSGTKKCSCRPDQKQQYLQKISGPLLDRFAVIWRVTELDHRRVSRTEWSSIRVQVQRARKRQRQRVSLGFPAFARNYRWEHLEKLYGTLPDLANHSFRRRLIPLQVAQTLADVAGKNAPGETELLEASQLCTTYSELLID